MQWVRSIVSLGRFVVARTGAGQESRRSSGKIENKAPHANGRWSGTSRRLTEVRSYARSGGDDIARPRILRLIEIKARPPDFGLHIRCAYEVTIMTRLTTALLAVGAIMATATTAVAAEPQGWCTCNLDAPACRSICPEPDPPLMMQEQGRRPQTWVYQPSLVLQSARVQRRHLYSYPY